MCMNMFMAGVKPEKQDEQWKFMHAIAPRMANSNRNGIGFAAMTEHGLIGERWLRPEDAFRYRREWTKEDQEMKDDFQGTIEAEPRYNWFLQDEKANGAHTFAVIMHTRMATVGEPALRNTHPFVRNNIALVHNGGIGNHQEKHLQKITSECDSETILNSYVRHDVNNKPDNILKVSHDLVGGYACGVLTHNDVGIPILDVFRNHPQLYVMYIVELDARVFCTSSQVVIDTCKELGWKIGSIFKVKDDIMLRMNAQTGRFLSQHNFYGSNRTCDGGANGYGNRTHFTRDEPKQGPANAPMCSLPIALGAPDDTEASEGDITNLQEIVELERTKSLEKEKKSLSTPTKKSPKMMELERARMFGAKNTGRDIVDISPINTKLH